MEPGQLTEQLRTHAHELGFQLVGACPAVEAPGIGRFHEWLAAGYGGEMTYLGARREAYGHPRHVLDGVRSLLVLGMGYRTVEPARELGATQGRVSRYGWGSDYHERIWRALDELVQLTMRLQPGATARGVVDTAPLLEREFAQMAGLGWIGKNTLLLNRTEGSWFFLAVLLTSAELAFDAPHATDHCGTCTACLDACPTDAFVAPYVLDSRKCISYLTIELHEPAPTELRHGIGDWVFGCDVCQDVCPWNHRAPVNEDETYLPLPGHNPLDLCELFQLDDAAFRARFRHTPLWRPKRRGLLRNAAIALGNSRATAALPALICGLNDEEPLVRGASAWALGELDDAAARQALTVRLVGEGDAMVQQEIEAALSQQRNQTAVPPN